MQKVIKYICFHCEKIIGNAVETAYHELFKCKKIAEIPKCPICNRHMRICYGSMSGSMSEDDIIGWECNCKKSELHLYGEGINQRRDELLNEKKRK